MRTMTPMRVVIADDELAARTKLRRLLGAHADVVIIDEVGTGVEMINAVRRHAPDLVFLDIRMPEIDGLSALATFDVEVRPFVVLVTAYDVYAVRAFAERVADYLLKPFDAARLGAALDHVRSQRELASRPSAEALEHMVQKAHDVPTRGADGRPQEYLRRITVRSTGKIELVQVADIEWIEAAGNYVRLHGKNLSPMLRESMRNLSSQLDPLRFARVHRGAMVNLDMVVRIEPLVSGDGIVHLRSGMRLRLSRSFRLTLHARLQHR